MNYSQYLQQGGGIENQIAQLVQAALSGDQQANSQIEQIMQAAQKGDKQAQQIAQMIQQIAQQLQGEQGESAQTEAMKCGGKMRAKVKKAACGKKMQMGAEIKKSKKVCACQLKKVGGKLIEVDGCTGLPIHRNGGSINKFQQGGLTYDQALARQKEMLNAQGFNAQLRGRNNGADGIWGNTSQSEWNRYQQWKQDQNTALFEKMKADKEAGMESGGPSVKSLAVAPAPAASSIKIFGPRQSDVDPNREAAIAAMSGRHISNRERQRYGDAYVAIASRANPAEMSQRQISDIQRMGRTYRPQPVAAKNGGSLTYAQFLGL